MKTFKDIQFHQSMGGNLKSITRFDNGFELSVIANTGYPGYFLIVQDLIAAARDMGVSVGPGRGSAAGSVVAYCLWIVNLDPIQYNLLYLKPMNLIYLFNLRLSMQFQ